MKFQVLVQRSPKDAGFVSYVYAVARGDFLVWDPDHAHFIWVNIDDHYYEGNSNQPYFYVTLFEE